MPYSITTRDGITIQNIPDDVAADAPHLKQRVEAIRAGMNSQDSSQQATLGQKVQASMPGRVLQGARDPIDAGAQLLPRALSSISSLGGYAPNRVSRFFDSEAQRVDSINSTNEAEYQAARKATEPRTLSSLVTGQQEPGFDGARLVGNIVSPANLAIASRLPVATTTLSRLGVGAAAGAAGGALTPVEMKPETDFASAKAAQVGLGAAFGGVLSPVLGKVGDKVSQWLATRKGPQSISVEELQRVARSIADDSGTKWENLEPAMQRELETQVRQSMASKIGADPAALARQADFKAEGMTGTLGQITRDARQFANERNLRQLPGTGDPLLQKFEQQGQQLTEKVNALAKGAANEYSAGQQLTGTLKNYDDRLSGNIRAAYRAARASAGKDQELPLQGLAQDAADVIDNFGDKVPSGVMNQLKKYGILEAQAGTEAPRKLFTVEEADKLLKVINSSGSRTDDAVNAALTQLRNGVKRAVSEPGADDVFAPARKLAASRFALHDAVPALKDAARGKTAPDDFVNRFLVNGNTDEVKALGNILKTADPSSYDQARAQIGEVLRKAAFGQNVAGDKSFSVDRYAKALADMGPDKLRAFFGAEDVARFERLGRIGAYMNQFPNASPVQTSNNWGALMSLASKVPGISPAINVAASVKTAATNSSGVKKALAAELPKNTPDISPEDVAKLGQLLGFSAAGAGGAVAQQVK